ncbi:MAG TPA: CBS domain-containing protein [Candidatus Kryptonia bacterium]|nr:CBS domain-containing protein [Candidatus Kryptonia bacterium]
MLVRYRMSSKVVTIEPQRSIGDARRLLVRHRIRQLPVMRDDRLVGIVTDRDLRAAPPRAKIVSDVMTSKPFVTTPDTAVDEAARLLRVHKINALPVVEKGTLIGIVTATDVLGAFIDLSGVAEPTYRIIVRAADPTLTPATLRQVIERTRGEVKWVHHDPTRKRVLHARLKAQHIDDVVTAIEGAGFDVTAVVAPPRRRL